jgi:molecular chaperone GrpE
VVTGVQVVLKKFHEFLEGHDVVPILAQGAPFDPTRHTAVERVPTTAQPEGTVLEEVRRGYLLGEKVLRPTMVKVAVPPLPAKSTPVEEIGA